MAKERNTTTEATEPTVAISCPRCQKTEHVPESETTGANYGMRLCEPCKQAQAAGGFGVFKKYGFRRPTAEEA